MTWRSQMALIDQTFREANEFEQCTITVGTKTLDVALARTPQQWAAGMTVELPDEIDGMLFDMGEWANAPFHMVGVDFPILIAFFDRGGSLVHAALLDPQTGRTRCPVAYRWALELRSLDPAILPALQAGLRLPP